MKLLAKAVVVVVALAAAVALGFSIDVARADGAEAPRDQWHPAAFVPPAVTWANLFNAAWR